MDISNSAYKRWTLVIELNRSLLLMIFILSILAGPLLLPPAQAQNESLGPEQKSLTIGFFVNWDDASMSSFDRNLDRLDMIIAEWLHLASDDGSLRENDPNRKPKRQISSVPTIPSYPSSRWADWELIHLGGNLYELRRLSGTFWVRHSIFTADDDCSAIQKATDKRQ